MVAENRLERYVLEDRIAVGGMAEVFRAKAFGAHGFTKTLAIKRILPDLAQDVEFEEQFIKEAKLAVDLAHANIVGVLDFGRYGGTLFIAMEYVDGLDLAAMLRRYRARKRTIPIPAALHMAAELSKGLAFAHARGVVHRDVSPSNVLLSRAGEVKIADFGIAQAAADRQPRPGEARRIMGKWRYMSPEQSRGDPLTVQSDLFSAGIVLYELFTGEKLFPGDDASKIFANIQSMEIPSASALRDGLPPRVDRVLRLALERDPAARTARAADMVRELTEISYESSIVATALDVAEAVAAVLDDEDDAPSVARKGIDALIREQLGGDDAAASTEAFRKTAVGGTTEVVGAADDAAGGGGGDAVDGLEVTDAAARPVTETLVRRGVDPFGVTIWEREAATLPAGPASLRGGRASGSVEAIADDGAAGGAAGGRHWTPFVLGAVVIGVAIGAGAFVLRSDEPRAAAVVADAAPIGADAVATASLTIDSVPQGARVTLDGEALDEPTPVRVVVTAGVAHRLHIDAEGYRAYIDDTLVAASGVTMRVRPILDAEQARLRVDTKPPGATVTLAGVELGTTPLDRDDVTPGTKLLLVIAKPSYKLAELQIDLVDGQTVQVTENLRSSVAYGSIDLHIDEGWADVYLRNKKLGQAPIKGLRLPVGTHKLRLYNPASQQQKFLTVEVEEGKTAYYRTRL